MNLHTVTVKNEANSVSVKFIYNDQTLALAKMTECIENEADFTYVTSNCDAENDATRTEKQQLADIIHCSSEYHNLYVSFLADCVRVECCNHYII